MLLQNLRVVMASSRMEATPGPQITVEQILGNEGAQPKRSDGPGLFPPTHLQDGFKPAEGLSGGKDLANGSLQEGTSIRATEKRVRLLKYQRERHSAPAPPKTAPATSLNSVGVRGHPVAQGWGEEDIGLP